jgi:hypothetical protein
MAPLSSICQISRLQFERSGFDSRRHQISLELLVLERGLENRSYSSAVSLSVVITAISSAKFAVVDYGDVSMFEVYRRCRSGPRTLTRGTPAFTGRALCVHFYPYQGSICYADRILGLSSNVMGEIVLICIAAQYAMLCRMLVRCLRKQLNNIGCFQVLPLPSALCDVLVFVLLLSASV